MYRLSETLKAVSEADAVVAPQRSAPAARSSTSLLMGPPWRDLPLAPPRFYRAPVERSEPFFVRIRAVIGVCCPP
jgi:hypothetical protein